MPISLVSELHLNCLEGSNRKLLFDLTPSYLISSIKSMLSSLVSEHLREITWSQQPSLASPFCTGKKKKCFRRRKSRSVLRDSAVRTRRERAEDEWDSIAPVGGRSSTFVEVFQQPHHKCSLIIQIQNSASPMFSANVLRCLTDGEKWTTGKMLVPGCSDSSKPRAAVLGPGSRAINSLCQTWCRLAKWLYGSEGQWPRLPGGSSQGTVQGAAPPAQFKEKPRDKIIYQKEYLWNSAIVQCLNLSPLMRLLVSAAVAATSAT